MVSTLVNASCGKEGVWLQVLGSGGPELNDGRASSGYIIWYKEKARLLVDVGSGSLFRFEQSKAALNDLDAVLLSHLHVDHSSDLPVLIKASFFSDRKHDLNLYGPSGNHLMPSVTNFVDSLFGPNGAYQYLSSYLDGSDSYRLFAHNVSTKKKTEQLISSNSLYRVTAISVHHGPIPALAWRVDIAGKRIVFSGDMSNKNNRLAAFADQADILVAHHAIPEESQGIARRLHMPPSVIGEVAKKAQVKKLVLSHRMNRSLGKEKNSSAFIRKQYQGLLYFADDLHCFKP